MSDTDTITTTTTVDDGDDTATDTGTATPEQDGTDADAGKGKPWAPPTEAEWKAAQAKLKKANAEAAAHRRQADELKRKGETESEAAVREAREAAATEAEKTWKPRYVRQSAKAALVEAGLIGAPDRLLRLIDVDAVEVDEEGDVSGLDEQIRSLRKDYPELFGRKGSARIDGSDRGDNGGGRRDGISSTSRRLLEQARAR